MARWFLRRLGRGAPFAVSCAVHLIVVGAALAVAARLAPRIEAVLHAELVPQEPAPPEVRDSKPAPRPVRKPAPPPPKPLQLPRLIESPAPAVAPPVPPAPEQAPVTTEPPAPKVVPLIEKPPQSDPPSEPSRVVEKPARQSPVAGDPGGPAGEPGASRALSETKTTGDLSSGVSLLIPTARGGSPGGIGPGGAGAGSGTSTASTTGSGAGGITRTAIPKGGYQVQPRYPASARRLGIQGTTVLRVFVAKDGRVAEVAVERTAGHPDLDDAAAEAVRRWRFEPALRGPDPVPMWVLLPVEFRLK